MLSHKITFGSREAVIPEAPLKELKIICWSKDCTNVAVDVANSIESQIEVRTLLKKKNMMAFELHNLMIGAVSMAIGKRPCQFTEESFLNNVVVSIYRVIREGSQANSSPMLIWFWIYIGEHDVRCLLGNITFGSELRLML